MKGEVLKRAEEVVTKTQVSPAIPFLNFAGLLTLLGAGESVLLAAVAYDMPGEGLAMTVGAMGGGEGEGAFGEPGPKGADMVRKKDAFQSFSFPFFLFFRLLLGYLHIDIIELWNLFKDIGCHIFYKSSPITLIMGNLFLVI